MILGVTLFLTGMLMPPSDPVRDSEFLGSIGVNSAISQRGESLEKTIECAKYLGIAWFRTDGGVPFEDLLKLNEQTGVKFSLSPGSGATDLTKLLAMGRRLATSGSLLAFEGPNEPNNWPVTYKGEKGGGSGSWLPVATFQRDLYRDVESDPVLAKTPVWSISEGGAETDNVGLEFLTVPAGSDAIAPVGTAFGTHANVHNYIYHPNSPGLEDNKTWNAADPSPACRVDGLYGEYGVTWAHHYKGYSVEDLRTLPRVTTETGCSIGGAVTEHVQALNLLSLYLDQYVRGWSYTAVYLLRDRVDESGNQQFGFYRPDYTPRQSAVYLHNLTTILAGSKQAIFRRVPHPTFGYEIPNEPDTVHHLVLRKQSRTFDLVVWSEKLTGTNDLVVKLTRGPAGVAVYDPTIGISPIEAHSSVQTIPLTLSDHPVVLEIALKSSS